MHPRLSNPKRTPGVALCFGIAALYLTGCSRPVAVPIPTPSSSQVGTICDSLVAALPAKVVDQDRRELDPPNTATVAWGMTPPITLRCGVGDPSALTPTSQLLSVNGVDWLPEQRSAGYVYTTVGRIANVELAVSNDYYPQPQVVAELTPYIAANDPVSPK